MVFLQRSSFPELFVAIRSSYGTQRTKELKADDLSSSAITEETIEVAGLKAFQPAVAIDCSAIGTKRTLCKPPLTPKCNIGFEMEKIKRAKISNRDFSFLRQLLGWQEFLEGKSQGFTLNSNMLISKEKGEYFSA
ncbi:hypothetical protein NE237_025558 [Protea cynaroides]|uniref:Uncharacterized protein n=1 Tax=Protea cynaroides TaxID=273540 RepID=A0A9Q0H234_9MAGN|nr:hypothetical protein NE237_025558 [Protea cynaroides]